MKSAGLAVFVAVDLLGGRVVRLERGDLSRPTVYSEDPAATAARWEDEGAEWLHVVDLAAAVGDATPALSEIERIISSVSIPVQVGGGVRSLEDMSRLLEAGATRVVAGTRAVEQDFLESAIGRFGDRVLVALDASEGRVKVDGWQRDSGLSLADAVRRAAAAGASRLMVTDIQRDGMMTGPNLSSLEGVLEASGVPVIASGGVSSADDIAHLAKLRPRGLEGVIVGRALYSGDLGLADARAAAAL